MGAYSPAPVVTPQVHARVMREIILPAIAGMAQDGVPYTGFLYAGLMIDKAGNPKTLEFNCRLGDPETQPILLRLKSDLLELLDAALEGKLASAEAEWDRRCALGVVLAAHGYPESRARATASRACPSPPPTAACSMPARAPRARAWSPTAGACCASPRWATSARGARARLRGGRGDPLRRHAVPQDIGHRALRNVSGHPALKK